MPNDMNDLAHLAAFADQQALPSGGTGSLSHAASGWIWRAWWFHNSNRQTGEKL